MHTPYFSILFLVSLLILGAANSKIVNASQCTPLLSGYSCTNPNLGDNGNLSFTFAQNTNFTMYNIGLACTAQTTAFTPTLANVLVLINSSGAATSTPANSSNKGMLSLMTGKGSYITSLKCFNSTGSALKSWSSNFTGYIWLSYTTSNSLNSTQPVVARIATFSQATSQITTTALQTSTIQTTQNTTASGPSGYTVYAIIAIFIIILILIYLFMQRPEDTPLKPTPAVEEPPVPPADKDSAASKKRSSTVPPVPTLGAQAGSSQRPDEDQF